MNNPFVNRRLLIERMRSALSGKRIPHKLGFSDPVNVKGGLRLVAKYVDGRQRTLVEDNNLVVSMGRKVMSRLIGGIVDSPTITKTVQGGIRIVRSTNGSPTSAYVKVYTDGNDTVVEGWTNLSGSAAWSQRFVGGVKTLGQLRDDINAVTGWFSEVLNGLTNVDAVSLVRTPQAGCLGNQSSYTSTDNAHSRTLFTVTTETVAVVADDLFINRIRFGSQGHDPNNTAIGKDVLASDEQLTSGLRAADLGNATQAADFLTLDEVLYPTSAQVAFVATLSASQGNGLNISEAGLFTPGLMVARKNFGIIPKTSTFGIEATWTLVF